MRRGAFTLVELLVTIAMIAILGALLLPALAHGKGSALKAKCNSNLRQLGISLHLYQSDANGRFPSRAKGDLWINQLKPGAGSRNILVCPADLANVSPDISAQDISRCSYLFNGWDDILLKKMTPDDWTIFQKSQLTVMSATLEEISSPVETIAMGERKNGSFRFYMDLFLNPDNFYVDLEEARHTRSGAGAKAGTSNYLFVDGSVRSIPYAKSICPLNMWGVLDATRNDKALCQPH